MVQVIKYTKKNDLLYTYRTHQINCAMTTRNETVCAVLHRL